MKKITKKYFAFCAFAFLTFLSTSVNAQIYWDFGTSTTLSAYPASGIPANITVDSITNGNSLGVPFLSTTSVSSGYTGFSAAGNAGTTAKTGVLDYTVNATTGSAFYEITLTPAAGFYINVTDISFGSRSTGTGPKKYSIRSSLDAYATEIAGDTIASASSSWGLRTETFSLIGTTGTALKLRIYGYAGVGSVSAINFRIDDLTISATAIAAIVNPLTADFNTSDICFGTTAAFFDVSVSTVGTVNSWSWNFGDGGALSTIQNPTHNYATRGLFNVQLIVTDNMSNIDTTTETIAVDSAVSNLAVSIAGTVATFTGSGTFGTSPYSYSFDLGEGAGYASISNPNFVYTYATPGTYTACLVVTDALGCSDTSCTTFSFLSTGINERTVSGLVISPNPSNTGIFTIEFENVSNKTTISIYNIIGKSIFTKEVSTSGKQSIDLSNQANGSYFINIKNDKQTITKKIIVNK